MGSRHRKVVIFARTEEMAQTIASRAPLVVHLLKRQLLCMSPAPSLRPEVFEELHEKRKQPLESSFKSSISVAFSCLFAVFKPRTWPLDRRNAWI